MNYNDILFLSGDIGLSTDNSILGKLIRWGQSVWTRKAKYSHAWVFISASFIIEALVKITLSDKNKYSNQKIQVYRIPLTLNERFNFCAGMDDRRDGAYGWDKYPLFAADAITTWIKRTIFRSNTPCFFFTKTFGVSNIPVCSELVVWGLYKFTSYKLKDDLEQIVDWRIVTPDYLYDLLQLPINQATLIYENPSKELQL